MMAVDGASGTFGLGKLGYTPKNGFSHSDPTKAFHQAQIRRYLDSSESDWENFVSKKKRGLMSDRIARAPAHGVLADSGVHVFVDDQNLFWGITNDSRGKDYRLDFGRLLLETARGVDGKARPVKTAYIAGVVPDDDYFWQVARNQGFEVKRGYLGANNRSKQDDAYLISEIVSTIYEKPGPSTIVLVAGDADYMPPLLKVLSKNWRVEIAFIGHSVLVSLETVTHVFRELDPTALQKYRDFPL
jgi:hypothetical protein